MQNRCRDRIDLINGLINRSNIYHTQVICAFDRLSMVTCTYAYNVCIVMSDELVLYTYVRICSCKHCLHHFLSWMGGHANLIWNLYVMRVNYSKFIFINVCVLLSLVDKIELGRELGRVLMIQLHD